MIIKISLITPLDFAFLASFGAQNFQPELRLN